MSSHDNRSFHTQPQRLLNLALALDYIERGFPVFPIASSGPRAKEPLTAHGFHDASIDPDQVRAWWKAHPTALVGIPTSAATIVVLDIDGPEGFESLRALCSRLDIENDGDLTPVRVRSPSGGLHLYFRLREGEIVRNRARDIGPGLDTRGVKENGSPAGYIIAAGNRRADGRGYEHIGESQDVTDAAFMPKRLLYLATFNDRQRAEIKTNPELVALIRDAYPSDWTCIVNEYRRRQFSAIAARTPPADEDATRRQALHDLDEAAREYASLQDNRRNGLFQMVCRCAKYVAHQIITENEIRNAFLSAARANGALTKHGLQWAQGTVTRALAAGRNDALPPVANRFRQRGTA